MALRRFWISNFNHNFSRAESPRCPDESWASPASVRGLPLGAMTGQRGGCSLSTSVVLWGGSNNNNTAEEGDQMSRLLSWGVDGGVGVVGLGEGGEGEGLGDQQPTASCPREADSSDDSSNSSTA